MDILLQQIYNTTTPYNTYHHQPPSKTTCDQLFDAADNDGSGGINKDEFAQIIGALCAQILSRMFVYYLVLIVFVPYVSTKVVDFVKIPNGSYLEMAAEQCISLSLFFLVIPSVWNSIDERTEKRIMEKVASMGDDDAATTTTTAADKSKTDKKDD
jgi:hypothetical protein